MIYSEGWMKDGGHNVLFSLLPKKKVLFPFPLPSVKPASCKSSDPQQHPSPCHLTEPRRQASSHPVLHEITIGET